MMRTGIFILIASCLIVKANAQNKTYFGLEFSVANDIFKITDTGDYLKPVPLYNAQGGIFIRQELGQHVFIESGVILKAYNDGFGFRTIPYYGVGSSDISWLLPLRIGLRANLLKERLWFVPVGGYTFGINPPFGYGLGYGTQRSTTTTISYSSTENPDVSRYFSLFQVGVGLEVKLFKVLLCTLSSSYYTGINNTMQQDIIYTVNNSAPYSGTAISKGEFWCATIELRYPISNLWMKEKD